MIVLDTHALITVKVTLFDFHGRGCGELPTCTVWWVSGDKQLSVSAREAIEEELASDKGEVMLSAISAWEIAMLQDRGRLTLTMDIDEWLSTVSSIEGVSFVSVNIEIGVNSVRLPGDFHKDPADRLIVALARHYSVPLVTIDAKIRAYQHVKTIW